jgi:hypothetical protein
MALTFMVTQTRPARPAAMMETGGWPACRRAGVPLLQVAPARRQSAPPQRVRNSFIAAT